jgi:hypothetical protein
MLFSGWSEDAAMYLFKYLTLPQLPTSSSPSIVAIYCYLSSSSKTQASPYLGQLLSESAADHIGATPLVQLNRLACFIPN